MAGSLAVEASECMEMVKSATAIGDQWEVQYSRFFNYPSLSSSSPSLTSFSNARRDRSRGTWISSTASSTASLNLTADHSHSEFMLTVNFLGKIHEQHYISKLHFSWPHVSCISGFPSRGSRVVFVSYRDCVGQIQKFALRFSTNNEIETFMSALKEIMGAIRDTRVLCSSTVSEISSQSEFIPSEEPLYRPKEDWSSMVTVDTSIHQTQSSLSYEIIPSANSQDIELNCDSEGIISGLPPSFMSLVMSCHPTVETAAAQPTVFGEVDLKCQITKYLGDSSFQDMLSKVEKVISEMGGDLML